jgi:hypothetical protein
MEQTEIIESKGYFIYYDKDGGMSNYMLSERAAAANTTIDSTPKPQPLIFEDFNTNNSFEHTIGQSIINDDYETIDEPMDVVSRLRRPKVMGMRKPMENRRIVNMLVGCSAVLLIVCFIMGAGLIQNENRIAMLEANLDQLDSMYRSVLAQARSEAAASVFAPENINDLIPFDTTNIIGINEIEVEPDVVVISGHELNTVVRPSENITNAEANVPVYNVNDGVTGANRTYTVMAGDNLNYISTLIYGDRSMVQRIRELNGIEDENRIYAGQVLILP